MGWFTLAVITLALAILAAQISQWFSEQSCAGSTSVSSSSGAPGLATSSYRQLPMAMTIPFAIAQARHDVVAQLRRTHRRGLRRRAAAFRRNLTGLNGARGLIAGLAVAQALGSSR